MPAEAPKQQSHEQPAWLTVAEAARILGVAERTVQLQCATGKLTAKGVDAPRGRTWLIDPACRPAFRVAREMTTPVLAGGPLAGLTDAKRRIVARRHAIVETYLRAEANRPADMTRTGFRAAWVTAHNARRPGETVGLRTVGRWLAAYRADGLAGLLDRRRNVGAAGGLHPEDWELIKGLYLGGPVAGDNRVLVTQVYNVAAAFAAERGRRLPTLRTVRRHLAEKLAPAVRLAAREPKMHRDRATPHILRDASNVAAMRCWVADHRPHDVWLPRRNEATGEWAWARPVLTLYVDFRTWFPVAWTIQFDAPNADRVMGAFAAGVEAHGLPEQLYLDNGKDFRAERFGGGRPKRRHPVGTTRRRIVDAGRVTPMLEMLGVKVHWALPYNARAKVAENVFKLVAERFDKTFETYCGNSAATKPEHLKDAKASDYAGQLTLERFGQAFAHYILDQYALRTPAGASMSRRAAFEGLRRPGFQAVRPPSEDLALLQTRSAAVCVTGNGVYVAAFGQYYDARDLDDRRGASGRDRRRKVRYHYRPDDASQIWVFDATTGEFLCIAEPRSSVPALAEGPDDMEKLADEMRRNRRVGRADREQVKRLRLEAAAKLSVLLAARGLGLEALGELDQDTTPSSGGGATPVLRLTAVSGAAQAGATARRKRARRRSTEPRAEDFYMATGTRDDKPQAAKKGPSALDILTGDGETDEPRDTA